MIRRLVAASTWPLAQLGELMNIGREEAVGPMQLGVGAARPPDLRGDRGAPPRRATSSERRDILSLLLQARTEEGEALSDKEVRDELLDPRPRRPRDDRQLAVLDLGAPGPQPRRPRGPARGGAPGEGAEEQVEATIVEAMRSRPVIPMIGRRVMVPWRLGAYARRRRHAGRR